MSAKPIKRVIITGAGFSAPADLPIQSKIIAKMTEAPRIDFLSGKLPLESIKFLNSYIIVGLFLLSNYGRSNNQMLEEEYAQIIKNKYAKEILEPSSKGQIDPDYYTAIISLKNKVRLSIIREGINISLEDIFTAFDKSVLSREYLHKYTYGEMDKIRYSIMRLFIYYFSKGVLDHTYQLDDYLNFIKYIKSRRTITPVTIITTNWDTLMEGYLERHKVEFQYGFRYPHISEDFDQRPLSKSLLLLKIHGSANWLRCLHCGSISVYRDNSAASSLFEDTAHEFCSLCRLGELSSEPCLQPEIITPTMIKSLSNRLYLNLWGAASSELRNATHIIFAGYSLPVADFDFRYLLQKNVSPSANIDVILYRDDDPSSVGSNHLKNLLPEKRYRDSFPKNSINFFYEGFGNYFLNH